MVLLSFEKEFVPAGIHYKKKILIGQNFLDLKKIMSEEFIYKILVVGNVAVGKTSLIKRYVHGIFSTSYKTTVFLF
jgi:GTPase SAR1 family protein